MKCLPPVTFGKGRPRRQIFRAKPLSLGLTGALSLGLRAWALLPFSPGRSDSEKQERSRKALPLTVLRGFLASAQLPYVTSVLDTWNEQAALTSLVSPAAINNASP